MARRKRTASDLDPKLESEEVMASSDEKTTPDEAKDENVTDSPSEEESSLSVDPAASDEDDGLIEVKGIGTAQTVAFWERDRAHPGGEVFVTVGATVRVAETPEVQRALRWGRLVRVEYGDH